MSSSSSSSTMVNAPCPLERTSAVAVVPAQLQLYTAQVFHAKLENALAFRYPGWKFVSKN
jgi:hypothetical protein